MTSAVYNKDACLSKQLFDGFFIETEKIFQSV